MAISYVAVLRYDPEQYLMLYIPKESLVLFNRFFSRLNKKYKTPCSLCLK